MSDLLSDRQAVEVFHLLFLRAIASGPQKAHLVVKGGCNLRFFFGSVRYSQDLDLDVAIVAKETLRKNVDKILAAPLLTRPLAAYGLAIQSASSPKQTDTTQRWKVALRAEGRSVPLQTKIEFSRRGDTDEFHLDPVDTALAHAYRMTPPLANHYLAPAAIRQKVRALAGRTEVQARDVFDLALLLARAGGKVAGAGTEMKTYAKAAERALAISYDAFTAQVVSYLAPDDAEPYASREAWEALQLQVVDAIEKVAR